MENLGHSIDGITYIHYAHRTPLVFRAIKTLPLPPVLHEPVAVAIDPAECGLLALVQVARAMGDLADDPSSITDEDPGRDRFDGYRVIVIARGQLQDQFDPFLSPIAPRIEN